MKETLLIIDDNPFNVKVLRHLFIRTGYNVLVAENGEEGIQITECEQPDLIVLDVKMPGINGFEVCHCLKSRPSTKNIPIIFITILTSTTDKIKGFQVGAADYITKPFKQEEVLARVTTHLTICKQQKQLQKYTAELEKRNMELDAFAHMVAHDLKNPLNAMVNITGLFIEQHATSLEAEWVKRLKFVEKVGQGAINCIDALLTLAGVSRQEVGIEPLDMSRIIAKVIPLVKEEYPGRIDLPDTWPTALGYAPWIEEVWNNYLSNGLKYGGKLPHLRLGANTYACLALGRPRLMARFWVQDNGIGLTLKEQEQLFTPFTRLHKNRAEGHGLGLSIVQQIIEKLGGQVGVESKFGQGSLFYFTLPAYQSEN